MRGRAKERRNIFDFFKNTINTHTNALNKCLIIGACNNRALLVMHGDKGQASDYHQTPAVAVFMVPDAPDVD